MIIFITEDIQRSPTSHFDERMVSRIHHLNIPEDNKKNLLHRALYMKNNARRLFPDNNYYAFLIGNIDTSNYPIVPFKGGKTAKIVDGDGAIFFGDQLWAIVKGRTGNTLKIIASNVFNTDEKIKAFFRVKDIIR